MKASSTIITGSVLVAFGCALALWVLFNLFIELQPESSRLSPAPAVFFSSALIAAGVNRASGGRWRDWGLWRERKTYRLAAVALIAFGLAYIYNMMLRLRGGFHRPAEYVSLVADAVLLLMYVRILKWLLEGRRPDGDDTGGE